MTTLSLIGLYLFSVCSVIFLMKLYIRIEGRIESFIVWGSFLLSFVPVVNVIISLMYAIVIAVVYTANKVDERKKKRQNKSHRGFMEHLLGVEKKIDYYGDGYYKHIKKEK